MQPTPDTSSAANGDQSYNDALIAAQRIEKSLQVMALELYYLNDEYGCALMGQPSQSKVSDLTRTLLSDTDDMHAGFALQLESIERLTAVSADSRDSMQKVVSDAKSQLSEWTEKRRENLRQVREHSVPLDQDLSLKMKRIIMRTQSDFSLIVFDLAEAERRLECDDMMHH